MLWKGGQLAPEYPTRAKGGNLLLNVGPKPNGEIQIEQESILREIALWYFINQESVHSIHSWEITNDNDVWFTQNAKENTIYAFVQGGGNWPFGERKEFIFKSIKGTEKTTVSVLGYNSQLVEYRKGFDASVKICNSSFGLVVSAVNGQRFYTNYQWPNPIVLKIKNAIFVHSSEANIELEKSIDGAK